MMAGTIKRTAGKTIVAKLPGKAVDPDPRLRWKLVKLLSAPDIKTLAFDLKDIPAVTDTLVSLIIVIQFLAGLRGLTLIYLNPRDNVMSFFDESGLSKILRISRAPGPQVG